MHVNLAKFLAVQLVNMLSQLSSLICLYQFTINPSPPIRFHHSSSIRLHHSSSIRLHHSSSIRLHHSSSIRPHLIPQQTPSSTRLHHSSSIRLHHSSSIRPHHSYQSASIIHHQSASII